MENQESLKTNINILYVEDDLVNQTVLKSMLSMIGFKNVMLASDAKTALELLENSSQTIDLVFMDLGLPDMDGVTLAGKIRQSHFKTKDVPIIALTGNIASIAKEKSLAAGMNGFLEKPLTAEQLRKALKEIL